MHDFIRNTPNILTSICLTFIAPTTALSSYLRVPQILWSGNEGEAILWIRTMSQRLFKSAGAWIVPGITVGSQNECAVGVFVLLISQGY